VFANAQREPETVFRGAQIQGAVHPHVARGATSPDAQAWRPELLQSSRISKLPAMPVRSSTERSIRRVRKSVPATRA
jgi:hypothetical protein